MTRISGVILPDNKRIDIALTYIYGIGRNNMTSVFKTTKIPASKRVKDLTAEEIGKIQAVIDNSIKVEGELRKEVTDNIKRLKIINSYRGNRHSHNLPSRGQRTRSNARTKRGKRVTIGAIKKEDRAKTTTTDTTSSTK